MALTRAALREAGVTDEAKLDALMDAHGATVELAKEKATAAAEKAVKKTIDDLQGKVDAFPVDGGKNEWKEKYDTLAASATDKSGKTYKELHDALKGEYDTYKTTVETEKSTAAKRTAARQALKALGAHDEDLDNFLVEKVLNEIGIDNVELDGDKVKDPKAFEGYKEQYKRYFGDTVTVGAGVATPPKGDSNAFTGKTIIELMQEANKNPDSADAIMTHIETMNKTKQTGGNNNG